MNRTWWAIERKHDDGTWQLQWNPARPCWPRLFDTRQAAREVAASEAGDGWQLRAVRVSVEPVR